MSEENLADAEFIALADAFVALANERSGETGGVKVGAAMLYAATRFNAYVVASRTQDAAELKADRAIALQHFAELHNSMLAQNIEDYETHYSSLIEQSRQP